MADVIPTIRILPMSTDEEVFRGKTAEEVQSQFFLRDLPSRERCGRYYYRNAGLKAQAGTIVLFQFDKRIIASAIFQRQERFEQPDGDYHGALYFDINSIRVFNPVGHEILHKVWPKFKGFSQVKWNLSVDAFPKFERQLTGIDMPTPSGQKKYGTGGEGVEHKRLKEWIANHPKSIGITNVRATEVEHSYLSGDSVDILFELKSNTDVVVEIETTDPLPGCHQAIKYRALRCAERDLPLSSNDVQAIIVAWEIPTHVIEFCEKYSIRYIKKRI